MELEHLTLAALAFFVIKGTISATLICLVARRLRRPRPKRHLLRLPLARAGNVRLIAGLAVVNLIVLAGTYLAHTFWPQFGWPIDFVGSQLDLGRENDLAVWYSSMLLFATGLAMVGCYAMDARAGSTGADRALAGGWLFGGWLFCALSFDELGSIHERLPDLAWMPALDMFFDWTAVLALPMLLTAVLLLGFAWTRLRTEPRALAFFVTGTLLYVSVPVQEYFEWRNWVTRRVPGSAGRPAALMILEEGSELFGTLAFLGAALTYARSRLENGGRHAEEVVFALNPRWVAAALALAALAALGLSGWYVTVVSAKAHWGIPQHWPPAALSAICAAVAAIETLRRRAAGRPLLAPCAVAAVMAFLSADHGAAHWVTEAVWNSAPARRTALDGLLAAAVLGAVGVVWMDEGLRAARTAIAMWAVLVFWSMTVGGLAGMLLASASAVMALAGLLRTLPAAGPTPG